VYAEANKEKEPPHHVSYVYVCLKDYVYLL